MKAFVVDLAKCNGCFSCQIVCKDEHCGADWSPIAKPQPETGQFWIQVTEKVRGQVPVVKLLYTPALCAHCADAPCAASCPSGAFVRRDDGLLYIDGDVCVGCGSCAAACPTHSIFMNDELHIAQKCTGCAHLLDDGWTVPRCVDACPTDALQFGEEEELLAAYPDAAPAPELAETGAHVYYLHVPKRFVACCVVDKRADEVVIGADVSIVDASGAVVASKATDEFGDCLFEDLDPARYTLRIAAKGYTAFEMPFDVTDEDKTLGDLFVEQA